MKKNIVLLPGDGVGPEVVSSGRQILDAIAKKFNHTFIYTEALIGASAIDKTGEPLPSKTLTICKQADAILFGAVGDLKYDNNSTYTIRPEQGLLRLRKSLELYANIRPISVYPSLIDKSPLKNEQLTGVDFIIVRELTGGIYFGKKGRKNSGKSAYDICNYDKNEIERIAHLGYKLALKRKKKVTLVDKANVLETSRLWREVIDIISKMYPNVITEKLYVDNASMQIIKNPGSFDVILTENMFGDILSDEASVISGSIGMIPSASIGEKVALYEPIHGSYPKAAGLNIANPIGSILSVAMMLEMSFHMIHEAICVKNAVMTTLKSGFGTKDIVKDNYLKTQELTNKIIEKIVC